MLKQLPLSRFIRRTLLVSGLLTLYAAAGFTIDRHTSSIAVQSSCPQWLMDELVGDCLPMDADFTGTVWFAINTVGYRWGNDHCFRLQDRFFNGSSNYQTSTLYPPNGGIGSTSGPPVIAMDNFLRDYSWANVVGNTMAHEAAHTFGCGPEAAEAWGDYCAGDESGTGGPDPNQIFPPPPCPNF